MEENSKTIFNWIFSFIIIVFLVVLVFLKISAVSSNQEFFLKVHSFRLSNVLSSVFLDDYFKIPYSLGSFENVRFKVDKDSYNNAFFVLNYNNLDYKSLLLIPENSKFVFEDESYSNKFFLEKKDDSVSFKSYSSCIEKNNDFSLLNLNSFKDFVINDFNNDFENIVLVFPEDNVDCKLFFNFKKSYSNKNVLLLRLSDEDFKTILEGKGFNKNFFIIVG